MMQQWFGYSDPAIKEALHDVPMLREFAGLDAGDDVMPDKRRFSSVVTCWKASHGTGLFAETTAQLAQQGLLLRQGMIVDATR